jgi:glycosyltransferase involved in cell wall biosynthesis
MGPKHIMKHPNNTSLPQWPAISVANQIAPNGETSPARNPLFSIIMPTYNRSRTIRRAVASVLWQSMSDWELIIVDDGSTDGSWAMLQDLASQDDRIRCFRTVNQGPALARNFALPYCEGSYVTFLDSDDYYEPEHLALRRDVLKAKPTLELLYGGMKFIGSSLIPDRDNPREFIDLQSHGCVPTGTITVSRETLVNVGGFPNLAYSEDSALLENLFASGTPSLRMSERTYVYDRTQPDSICNQIAQRGRLMIG